MVRHYEWKMTREEANRPHQKINLWNLPRQMEKNYKKSVRMAEALAKMWLNPITHKYKSDKLWTCLVRERSKCSEDKPSIKYIYVTVSIPDSTTISSKIWPSKKMASFHLQMYHIYPNIRQPPTSQSKIFWNISTQTVFNLCYYKAILPFFRSWMRKNFLPYI